MGTLIYDSVIRLDVEDRILDHLRVVVFTKLRGKESFPLTVLRKQESGADESVYMWISSESALGFQLVRETTEELSHEWLETLLKMSYTSNGLVIRAQPAD